MDGSKLPPPFVDACALRHAALYNFIREGMDSNRARMQTIDGFIAAAAEGKIRHQRRNGGTVAGEAR